MALFCFRRSLVFGIVLVTAGLAVAAPETGSFDKAGEWLINTWETEDGLPENSATAMTQTPDGYLWFGTFSGLVRFDGVKFTVLDPANTPQIPSRSIVNLHLDQKGRMWVSTYQGLVVREGTHWHVLGTNEGWSGDFVRTFSERRNGDLLITTFDGKVLEFANGHLTELPRPPGKRGEGYLGLVDEAGQWWVAHHQFIGRWDGQRWLATVVISPVNPDAVGCATARDGGLLILSGPELRKYRLGNEVSRVQLPELPGGVWSMSEDSRSNVWICTRDNGVCQVSPDGQMRRWTATNGLSHNAVRFAFEDRENNVWIGTSGGGLTRFKAPRFQSFGPENGLSERVVKSVAPNRTGGVWIATYGKGLFQLSETGLTEVFLPGRKGSSLYAQSVLNDREGRTWVGTYTEGLWVSDKHTFRQVGSEQTGGDNVIALFQDSRGRIWLSGSKGVAVYDAGSFRVYGPEQGPSVADVRCFAEDSRGILWLSNLTGVFRLVNDLFVEVRDGENRPLREITSLKSDDDETLWMGSLNEGLLRWRHGSIARIGPETGLPVRAVHGVLEDDRGFFWMSSNRGIVRAHRKDLEAVAERGTSRLTCQLLGLSDGLPSVECASGQQPVCARDTAGRLWFATIKGVAVTDPSSFSANLEPPSVHIEELTYQPGSRAAAAKHEAGLHWVSKIPARVSAPFGGSAILPAGSRRIEIHYTAPSFVAPEKVRFQVKLAGYDAEWQDVGSERVAYLNELPPGNHSFHVRAANNDGVWNTKGASLAFTVQPLFWQTAWFRTLTGFAVAAEAALIFALILEHRRWRRVNSEVQYQRAELAHVSRVTTLGELASSLAHELNHPQTAILSNAQAGELFLNANPPALDEVRKIFADIVRDNRRAGEIIQRMRAFLQKQELKFEPVDVNPLIHEVVQLIDTDASTRKVTLQLNLAAGLPAIRADRVHVQQVLLNLFLNAMDAMNATPANTRLLRIESRPAESHMVEVAVKDSGAGIPASKLASIFEPFYTTKPHGMGMGLSIARSIVEAHSGRIWAENNADGGATVRFTVALAGGAVIGNQ